MVEQTPIKQFKKPVSVLEISLAPGRDHKRKTAVLTGAAALLGYALLYASRSSGNTFVLRADLISVINDSGMKPATLASEGTRKINAIESFFSQFGVGIEKRRVKGEKTVGASNVELRLKYQSEDHKRAVETNASFSIREWSDTQGNIVWKFQNSLLRKVDINSGVKQLVEGETVLVNENVSPVTSHPSVENTQALFSAISFPVDANNPFYPFGNERSSGRTSSEWKGAWERLGQVIGTDRIYEEIAENEAKYFGAESVTRQAIQQSAARLIDDSYEALPHSLQQAFPKELLSTHKPNSIARRVRNSRIRGGKLAIVAGAVNEGLDYDTISNVSGVGSDTLSYCRSKGIQVPYKREAISPHYQVTLRALADGELDDRQINLLFDDIERYNRRGLCYDLRKKNILVSLSEVGRAHGVFIKNDISRAYELLKRMSIPIVRVKGPYVNQQGKLNVSLYCYVLNNHEATQNAFADSAFNEFRK